MPVAAHLADTNILLRVSQRQDPNYDAIRKALHALRTSGAALHFTSQNLAEFWNVCTRPAAQNGYGLGAYSRICSFLGSMMSVGIAQLGVDARHIALTVADDFGGKGRRRFRREFPFDSRRLRRGAGLRRRTP